LPWLTILGLIRSPTLKSENHTCVFAVSAMVQAGSSWEYASVSTSTPHSNAPFAWRLTSRQPIGSGATCSAGRAKKD